MKKTFKFFAAALTIVAAASCAKEITNDDIQAPEQELVRKVFTASFDTDTKTTLADDGLSVHWIKDDVIKVIPAGSKSGSDFSVVSCNETFADFVGETVDADSYRAIYPSSAYNEEYSSAPTFVFSNGSAALSMQYAVEGDFSIAANFGVSSNFAVSQPSKDGHLYFQNINAFLKFQLSMDNASVVEVSSSRVTAYPNSYMLSSTKDLGGTINYVLGDKKVYITSDEIITFKTEDASNLKSGVEYYIAIPAVEIEGLSIVIKDKDGGVINTYNRSRTLDAVANTIYDLGILEPKPAAKVGDYFYSDGTYSTELDSSKEVVGVVFYAGDPKDRFNDPDLPGKYGHGLAVSIKTYSTLWNSSKPSVSNELLKVAHIDLPSHNTCGYTIKNLWASEGISLNVYNYNYGTLSENTSGWYLGTLKEWTCLFENITAVNNTLANVSGSVSVDPTSTYPYALPLYSGKVNFQVYRKSNGSTGYQSCSYDMTTYQQTVRPIFAF